MNAVVVLSFAFTLGAAAEDTAPATGAVAASAAVAPTPTPTTPTTPTTTTPTTTPPPTPMPPPAPPPTTPPPPTTGPARVTRALLLPIEADGFAVPFELVPALAPARADLWVESSSCADREACRADARARGIDQLLHVRIQRLADQVVIAATLVGLDESVLADATDAAPPTAAPVAAAAVVDRLAVRAARARRAAFDADGDGVLADDRCPELAGVAALGGCPDGDGDGVADDRDRCPVVAATTPDGCPAPAVAVGPDPVPPRDEGPEWGRITGGAAASFLGTALGTAAGAGATYLLVSELSNRNVIEFTDTGYAVFFGTGGGLGALFGSLALDVTSAGLCQYPLSASGWTRFVAVTTATAAGAAGSAVGAVGLVNGDADLQRLSIGLLAAAPVLSALEVGAGNCISGPP